MRRALALARAPRAVWLAAGAAGLGAAGLLAAWTPSGDPDHALCIVRRATAFACPGCGLARALSALAHGDLARAVALHPLAPAFAAQALAGWLAWGVHATTGRRALSDRAVTVTLIANAAALLAVWAARLAAGTLPR